MLESNLFLSLIFILGPTVIITALLLVIYKFKSKSFFWYFLERIMAGYVIFWLLYILFPAFLNVVNPIQEGWTDISILNTFLDPEISSGVWSTDLLNFIRYIIQFFANSIMLYLFYPLTLFPIVFIIGPLISFFVLWRQLNKAGTEPFLEKLNLLQFETESSPTEMITERLTNRDWSQQKDLLKILLAVLPISLYLLMTLMKVTGFQERSNILSGTSLGWFLEIFFVYLATLMFGVHLLYSAKLSFKGDYIGLRVRDAMVQSLSTVGLFISLLAVALFLIDYQDQIFVVLYFVGYFVMVTLIFILVLDIFEPISVFLLMKIVETVKNYGPSESTSLPETESERVEPETVDIFVPEVNLDELSAEPSQVVKEIVEEPSEKEVILPEAKDFKEIHDSLTGLTLRRTLTMDILKYASVTILAISIFILTAHLLIYLMKTIPAINNLLEISIDSQYSTPIAFFALILIFSPSLLIPILLVSRKLFIPALISIFLHIFIILVDFVLRNFLLFVNTDVKFSEVAYQTFYYVLQYNGFVIFLGLSVLFLRRFKWEVFPNIAVLVLSGFLIAGVWMFLTQQSVVLDVTGFGEITIFPSIHEISTRISSFSGNSIPFSTFNPTVQGLIPFVPFVEPVGGEELWITVIFQPVLLQSGQLFLNPFLVEVPVDFSIILAFSSLPFRLLRDISNVMLFGLLFFFIGREFLTVIIQKDEKGSILEKNVFSVSDNIPDSNYVVKNPNQYAIIRNFGLEPLIDEYGRPIDRDLSPLESAIYNMELGEQGHLGQIILEFTGEEPITFAELSETTQTQLSDVIKFFNFIDKTQFAREKPFTVIRREYGYEYEEAKMDSLHIMMTDGRSVFTHSFQEESNVEPALVAGLFSAITSFAKEAVKAEKLLRTIDHGDVVLIIEYGRFVFAALFVDRNSIDLRNKLSQFLQEFETKHEEDLENWLGDTSTFAEDWQLVEEIFGI